MVDSSLRNCGQCLTAMAVAFAESVSIGIVSTGVWIGLLGLEPQISSTVMLSFMLFSLFIDRVR